MVGEGVGIVGGEVECSSGGVSRVDATTETTFVAVTRALISCLGNVLVSVAEIESTYMYIYIIYIIWYQCGGGDCYHSVPPSWRAEQRVSVKSLLEDERVFEHGEHTRE